MKITKPWNGSNFLYYDHTHFLLLTHPHSSMLLSVVSSHSQLNWLDQVWEISLNHSMAMDKYKFKVQLGRERCVKMILNSIDVKTLDFASIVMLIMCCTSKEFMGPFHGSVIFVVRHTCYDQRRDTERKHNSTTLMSAEQQTTRLNNITSHVIQKYMLIYAISQQHPVSILH